MNYLHPINDIERFNTRRLNDQVVYKEGKLVVYKTTYGYILVADGSKHVAVSIGKDIDNVYRLMEYQYNFVLHNIDTLPKRYDYPMRDFINQLIDEIAPYNVAITSQELINLLK